MGSVFDHNEFSNHESVLFCHDETTGLKAIIALHNTSMGPAAGGCRMFSYPSVEPALKDALYLSKRMSYKNVLAGLPLGGGKAIIIGNPNATNKKDLLKSFARHVQKLNGRYWTTIEGGITFDDLAIIAEDSDYVFALANEKLNRPHASIYTAIGSFVSIQATIQYKFGKGDLDGIRVAVQGLGGVGRELCRLLYEAGVQLWVADMNEEAVKYVVEKYKAKAVAPDDIYHQDVDVFAPCALSAILNDQTIPRIQAPIVCGSANNQLQEERHDAALLRKGVLYAPDYVVNSGGMWYGLGDIFPEYDVEQSMRGIRRISDILHYIFQRSETENRPTHKIADEIAQERISLVQQSN